MTQNIEERMLESVPEELKECIAGYQMHAIAEQRTGLDEFTIPKIAEFLGGMAAARRAKWAPVADGIVAYAELLRRSR
jgi:hypothetical protein